MPATTLLAELRYRARANPGAAALQSRFLRYKWGLESECPIDHVYVMIVTQWNLHTVSAKKCVVFVKDYGLQYSMDKYHRVCKPVI